MWRDTGSANTQRGDRGGLSEKHLSARTGERPQEVPNVALPWTSCLRTLTT